MLLGAIFFATEADAACTVTATSVNFGAYNVYSASAVTSTGNVQLRCSGTYAASVVVSMTRGASSSFIPRTMMQGSQALQYNLFGDTAYTLIWGDGSSGTVQCYVSYTGTYTLNIPVYGRVPAGQDVGVGAYSDTVTVVVNY